MQPHVEVEGLQELKRALKQVDAQLPKEMRLEFKAISTVVAARVASKVPSITGRAASSVKPRASQDSAGVAEGGKRAPYMGWLDFGGGAAKGRGVTPSRGGQFGYGFRRPFIKEGRYLYPTVAEMEPEILDAAEQAVENVLRKVT